MFSDQNYFDDCVKILTLQKCIYFNCFNGTVFKQYIKVVSIDICLKIFCKGAAESRNSISNLLHYLGITETN